MKLEEIADRVIETDVLIMGGGIGGCCAAAKAAEHGLKVVLAEKANPERSGSAAMGIDHYGGFPKGTSVLNMVNKAQKFISMTNGPGRFLDPNLNYKIYDSAFWALEELEKLGVSSKWDDGEYRWMPEPENSMRGGGTLRVHWQNIKPQLAKAVKERGVEILQWTPIIDFLTNEDKIVGATALNSRTGELIVIKAKAVVVATGSFGRCYEGETPLPGKYKFKYHFCPASLSGDGHAAVYRAGGELVNMELTGFGFKIRDDLTISYGNLPLNEGIPMKVFTWNGQEILNPNTEQYAELEKKGLTPIYESIENLSDDWHKRIEVCYTDERLVSFKIAEDRGFNPKTHRYELMALKPYQFSLSSGVCLINDEFQTSIKGLYATGDCTAGATGCSGSIPSGLYIGDNIYKFVNTVGEISINIEQVMAHKELAMSPLNIQNGIEPMELECSVRHICERYVGINKSEGKLREGLRRLNSLKREFLPKLMAKTPHYLTRCLEIRNIMDLAEVHIYACLERKETRGGFFRADYPQIDPLRTNMATYQRMENGKSILEIREVPDLKQENIEKGC